MRYILAALLALSTTAHATDYANSPYKGWADKQQVTDAARPRFNCTPDGSCSCCDGAEIAKTQFRVDRVTAADQWWYKDGNTWRRIPDDIIHFNERAPNGDPVLFIYMGIPRCFWIPDGGI